MSVSIPFLPGRLGRTVLLGIKSLWLHRLRSLLTVLGIVFGVCSVIAMLAVGEGASYEAQEQIRRLGSNNIIIRSIKPQEEQSISSTQSRIAEYGLTYLDLRRIRDTFPGVKLIVPGRIIRKHAWCARQRIDAEIVGSVPWYPKMNKLQLDQGRYFNDMEMEQCKNVCVLSKEAENRLFPLGNAIQGKIRVDSDYYEVIGVIRSESTSKTATPGNGSSNGGAQGQHAGQGAQASTTCRIYIPLTAAKARFGEILMKRRSGSFEAERVELHEATIQVAQQSEVEETALVIRQILEDLHKQNDFEIVVPLALLRQAERTKRIFNIVLGAIAAISLLVGGIGIMNIMLASVTERTREIGIRRALGAKRRDIIIQFLIETVLLSGVGGLIGVGLGITIPYLITWFANMVTIITPWAPLAAFSISGLVGIIFGIYPALRAANMDPVEALRHE